MNFEVHYRSLTFDLVWACLMYTIEDKTNQDKLIGIFRWMK